MDKLRNYDIEFSGLKVGKHRFSFEIGEAFFQMFEIEQEFGKPRISVEVLLDKHTTFLELFIKISGKVELICDITVEPFDYPLENQTKVLVKYGDIYDDSSEEVIIISHQDYAFNIAQLIYESVVLAIPMKKISPNVTDEDLDFIEKFSSKVEEIEENVEEIDPRWEALKKIKK